MWKFRKQTSYFIIDSTVYPIDLTTLYFKYRDIGKGLLDDDKPAMYKRWIDVRPYGFTLRFLSSTNEDISQDNIIEKFELLYCFLNFLTLKYIFITEDIWEKELSKFVR